MKATVAFSAAAIVLVWYRAAAAADGATLFGATCQACHQAGGVGAPGLAPPLVSTVIANAASKQKDYPALVVINGLSGPIRLDGGGSIASAMPPQQGLRDDEIAAVINYIFRLNHTKAMVTAADVGRVRGQPTSRDALRQIRSDLTP
jgi:mono/diheme cytochrome c family protein